VLWLILRFLVLAAVIVPLLWKFVIPYYAWFISFMLYPLHNALGDDIARIGLALDGMLNTKTQVLYHMQRGIVIEWPAASPLYSNIGPYIALVLATGGITWKRRFYDLLIGLAVLFACQVAFTFVMVRFRQPFMTAYHFPEALGQFFMTLPFLLWIVLAYWQHIRGLFAARSAE
jgi:hypothetical protein